MWPLGFAENCYKKVNECKKIGAGSSVSDPYSWNPDPAKKLNPDPSYLLTLSEKKIKVKDYKNLSSEEVN